MFKSILLPIDVEHESSWNATLPLATRIAKESGASLDIVAVVPPVGSALVDSFFPGDHEEEVIDHVKERLADIVSNADTGDVNPKLHVIRGTIYEEILKAADQLGVDLIVVAAHRPELKDFLIGPNAARVVRHAKQSVFVVRH